MRDRIGKVGSLVLALALAGCAQVPGSERDFSVAGSAPPAASGVAVNGKGVRMAGGVYEGAMRNGVPEGQGVFRYDDGRRYEGQFAGGRFNGAGRMVYPDGRRVDAQFRNDFEETGTLTYPDGRVFDGQLQKGVPQGKGTMSMRDGTRVTGAFQNGRVEGRAMQSKPDGSSYFGPFSNGVPQGSGICGGPSGSGLCNRSGNIDTTAQDMRKLADVRALKAMEDAAKAERDKLEREAADKRKPDELERDRLQAQRKREGGPENDPECSCVFSGCIIVGNANDPTPPEVYRIKRMEREMMCRNRYAGWLNAKDDPGFARRMAELEKQVRGLQQKLGQEAQERRARQQEIDAALARRKADQAERDRMRQAELDKADAERRKKHEEHKQRCRNPDVMRSNPCACSAALNIPLPPTRTVCEA